MLHCSPQDPYQPKHSHKSAISFRSVVLTSHPTRDRRRMYGKCQKDGRQGSAAWMPLLREPLNRWPLLVCTEKILEAGKCHLRAATDPWGNGRKPCCEPGGGCALLVCLWIPTHVCHLCVHVSVHTVHVCP